MGTFLIVLACMVFVLVFALFLLGARYEQEKVARSLVMTPAEEAQFEIITPENIGIILDHQMAKSQGLVEADHPAFAMRKIIG